MNFTKAQGTGNDFILIEAAGLKRDWGKLAVAMCDRHFGIGGDGLILVLPSKRADFRMRIFNSDGSEAEVCGNGIRCLARYVFDKGLVSSGTGEIAVETLAGVKRIGLHKSRGKLTDIMVGMGVPVFEASKIPVTIDPAGENTVDIKPVSSTLVVKGRALLLSFISMGNPHAVFFTDKPVSDFPLAEIGPQVENHRMFPRRINFEIAQVIDRYSVVVRVWERGAGETSACGTGACAVAVASRLSGYTGDKVDIMLPGGVLGVAWDGSGEVFLSGPAEIVFTGEWPE